MAKIKRDVIKTNPLFDGLPADQIDAIDAIAVETSYGRGQTIFFEGEEGKGFFMVNSGKVKIFKVSSGGKEHILHIFGPGEPFGEVSVFHDQPFPATAEALEKTTCIRFPHNRFIALVKQNPSIALNMLGVLSRRLRRFAQQIENLSLKEVPARLAGYLLYLSEEQQNRDKVTLDIAKGQLASLLGTIPETLSRIFAKMTEAGLIQVKGRVITILDRQSLEEME